MKMQYEKNCNYNKINLFSAESKESEDRKKMFNHWQSEYSYQNKKVNENRENATK